MTTRFERDTAVTRVDERTFTAEMHEEWWVERGPNGGYLAAILMRALTATVDDPARAARSLTVHYPSPPVAGLVTITTTRERVGRSLTSVSARLEQDGRPCALAMAAFATVREGPDFTDLVMPDAPPPDELPVRDVRDDAPPFARRWSTRWAVGRPPMFDGVTGPEAVGGGWIRLEDPQLLDAPAVAALTDAWIPPVFVRVAEPLAVPTIDLTVHFRTTLPLPDATPDDYLLAVFRTNAAAEGFLEEDGLVWSADGRLVAQSRQLAVAVPFTPPG